MADTETLQALRADYAELTEQVRQNEELADARAAANRDEVEGLAQEIRGYRSEIKAAVQAIEQGRLKGVETRMRSLLTEIKYTRADVRALQGMVTKIYDIVRRGANGKDEG